ncbi:hypothetical protein Salat_0180600 [Sesamum alatum]|uniref:Uncharacterized protein n=1 Tax=Sesamum alatum TaxID=300844 RepID=A0AAE1YZ79_9LAMI|nr:hypothetical protein Salat_0180600 [Sesamum alatum]
MSSHKRSRGEGSSSQSAPPIPRSRSQRGPSILPPSTEALGGHLTFQSRTTKERYATLCTRSISPCKTDYYDTLRALHIHDSFNFLVDNIGWRCFFDCTENAYIELTREFDMTFKFSTPIALTLDTPRVLKFRLMGRSFSMSLAQLNIALGFTTEELAHTHDYMNSLCDYRDEFNPIRIKVNLGFGFATQLQSTLTKNRALILGSYTTVLATNLGVFDPNNHQLHTICVSEPLDMACLVCMGLVLRRGDSFEFAPTGPSMPPDVSSSQH